MKYLGSKNRISKELAPIIQKYIDDSGYENYLEPFVGGANMIDKIKCKYKYGGDNHKYLIALLKQAATDASAFPLHISEEEYIKVRDNKSEYPDWYVGLVGFCSTFGGRWFNGYARGMKSDRATPRDIPNETIRKIVKQSPKLKGIEFSHCDFRDIKNQITGFVIYCDPPYRGTTKYAASSFPYDEFYDWCRQMSRNNIVLVSEYNMPTDFECIWEKQVSVSMDSKKTASDPKNKRTERLFIYRKAEEV